MKGISNHIDQLHILYRPWRTHGVFLCHHYILHLPERELRAAKHGYLES